MLNYGSNKLQHTKYEIDDNSNQNINYIDELNNQLIEKDGIIQNQNYRIQSLNNMIDNLKTNIKSLHEKLSENEKLKINLNAQIKKMQEMELELDTIKKENM